ncbi:glycosyl hydrolase family 62 protein [Coprinopsis marcescibilis]|uniref:Alpha-L-arabinofuranosidase n=1 Tax=Coprinopsis marcescibilis TaxID=230819 RepID=A0A5C3KJ00_COPMA|nr:glycosyl hydrolase family 62 protein [Coprinopsis marcescibilis]
MPYQHRLRSIFDLVRKSGDIQAESTTPTSRLPSHFTWLSGPPLIAPKNDSRNLAALKDPSIVFYEGAWHLFASTAHATNGYNLVYLTFTSWDEAGSVEHHYLDQSAIGTGYRAAPQIFYFAPQKLWYLVFQDGNAGYSTNPDVADPNGWSAVKHFHVDMPQIIRDHIGNGYWLDFWVICDEVHCHLFSSDDNGQLYRSWTPVGSFPEGFNDPVIAMQDADRWRLFEACNVYRYDGRYLLLVEAIGTDERRWFRSWTSDRIEGPWEALAAEEDHSFARANNVEFEGGVRWTEDISHGELIRSGVDEKLEINPCDLVYVYQGMRPDATGEYNSLPWRLALITQTNSEC